MTTHDDEPKSMEDQFDELWADLDNQPKIKEMIEVTEESERYSRQVDEYLKRSQSQGKIVNSDTSAH